MPMRVLSSFEEKVHGVLRHKSCPHAVVVVSLAVLVLLAGVAPLLVTGEISFAGAGSECRERTRSAVSRPASVRTAHRFLVLVISGRVGGRYFVPPTLLSPRLPDQSLPHTLLSPSLPHHW
jgi:hypothetical protein